MTNQHAKTRAKRYRTRQHNRQRDDRTHEEPEGCLNCDAPREDPKSEYCDICTTTFLG